MIVDLFLRDADSLYDRDDVQGYLQHLIQSGYRLCLYEEEEVYQNAVPEVSLLAREAFDEYLAQKKSRLTMHVYSLGEVDIDCSLIFKPEEGIVTFVFEGEDFDLTEEGREAYLGALDLLKEAYTYWHPFYGYERYEAGEEGGVQPDRLTLLATREIHYLYFLNFLGPEIVAHLGKEQLLNAPAWKSETLDEGGILLIPVDLTGDETAHSLKQAAVSLNLQTPQAPGEGWIEDRYGDH